MKKSTLVQLMSRVRGRTAEKRTKRERLPLKQPSQKHQRSEASHQLLIREKKLVLQQQHAIPNELHSSASSSADSTLTVRYTEYAVMS